MLKNRSKYEVSKTLCAKLINALKTFAGILHCDIKIIAIPEYLLILLLICLYRCYSYECSRIDIIETLVDLWYFYLMSSSILLVLYLLIKVYHEFLDFSIITKHTLRDIIILFLPMLQIHLIFVLCYNHDNTFMEKFDFIATAPLHILKLYFPFFLSSFLSFPRKFTLNLCLGNLPAAIVSVVIIKYFFRIIVNQ